MDPKVVGSNPSIPPDLVSFIKFKKVRFYDYFYNKYTPFTNTGDVFFYQTKIRLNCKYFISLLYNNYMFFFLGKRNKLNISLKKFNNSLRFFNVNYLCLTILKKILKIKKFTLIFFYKNFHFLNLNFFFEFFKLINILSIDNFFIIFNFNLLFQLNKYFKKVKTIKKFKKKIYQRQFISFNKNTYFL